MGLIVNLTTRTVHGFREQFDRDGSEAQLKITEVKEAILLLRGQMGINHGPLWLHGPHDR
jgi:hypothetical protein